MSASASGMDGVRAMVLAAGRGERLRPLTDTVPKPLVRVGGRPLVDYALETVARAGIRRAVLNLHHLGSLIREHVGDGSRYGLEVGTSPTEVPQKASRAVVQTLLSCIVLNATITVLFYWAFGVHWT